MTLKQLLRNTGSSCAGQQPAQLSLSSVRPPLTPWGKDRPLPTEESSSLSHCSTTLALFKAGGVVGQATVASRAVGDGCVVHVVLVAAQGAG
jgi:hypothetical protein